MIYVKPEYKQVIMEASDVIALSSETIINENLTVGEIQGAGAGSIFEFDNLW